MKYFSIIIFISFTACNLNVEQSSYINCQWYLVCGRNPLDVDCQFCQFYMISDEIIDIENKLHSYNASKDEGTLCHFIHFYEDENKLYLFPKDYHKPVTIYLDEFSIDSICIEFFANQS